MNVVILGGGYAGVWCYRALRRWLGNKANITVVADSDCHSFHGFVADSIGGHLDHKLLQTPLHECMGKAQRVLGSIERVDEQAKTVAVRLANDGGEQQVAYDYLVVATGAVERTDHISGLAEHSWGMRHPKAAGRMIAHLDELRAKEDEAERAVVVIGSGFTGTEIAAAIARRLGTSGKVTLVSSSARLIPNWAKRELLQLNLHKNLRAAAVEVIVESRVAEVSPTGVTLADGRHLAARTVVNASGNIGVIPAGLEHHVDPQTGLLAVDRNLRVSEHIWAAGDVAATRNRRGELVVKDALWATATGTKAGRNIARVARHAEPKPFNFIGLGAVATFGPKKSVALLYGVPLPTPIAYVIRMLTFFWFVPSRVNAVRMARSFYTLSRPARTSR